MVQLESIIPRSILLMQWLKCGFYIARIWNRNYRMSPVGDVHFYAKKTVPKRCRKGGVCIMVFMVSQYFGAFGADIAPFELVFAPIDSWDSGLSIGAKTSSDGSVDLELWRDKVGAMKYFFLQKMWQKCVFLEKSVRKCSGTVKVFGSVRKISVQPLT